jgi:hypothetical protein
MRAWLLVLAVGCGPAGSSGMLAVTPAIYHPADQSLIDVSDGDRVGLERPPQGGIVLFVGARVRGLGDPTVELRGRLLDLSGAPVAEEGRVVDLNPTPGDATLWQPDLRSITSVSNIAVCPPPSTEPLDRFDRVYTLEVVVTERVSGRAGSARRRVTAACLQSDPTQRDLCRCVCAAGFVIGKCGM